MVMNRLEAARNLPENSGAKKQFAIDTAKLILENAGVKDPGMPVVTPVEKQAVKTPETSIEVRTFSKDQLIMPSKPSKEAKKLLTKAEQAGFGGMFEVIRFSGVRLTQNTQVPSWNKKPWRDYWDYIENGSISPDAAKLPEGEFLIDTTRRPDYNNGRQLHKNDPLGPFLKTLRKEKKIPTIKGIPDTSRFGIYPDELYSVVFAEIENRLEREVRLPTEIEFNIAGNFLYRHFGEANTSEWFHDKFGDAFRLIGGGSGNGGLAHVHPYWSGRHVGNFAFRPLVAVSPKA